MLPTITNLSALLNIVDRRKTCTDYVFRYLITKLIIAPSILGWYYYLETIAYADCEPVHCPFARQIQRMTHDDHVTHIAIDIHATPRIACPHLASVDVQC